MSGVAFALFMLLHPYDELAGVHGPHSATWVPSHTFHFLGALLGLFGLLAVREHLIPPGSRWGTVAFAIAFTGTAMFVGTGMITAFVWPVIAHHDPSFVASSGPMFTDPLTARSIEVTYILMVVGYVLLAFALTRARLLSALDSAAVGVGILLFSAPVEPVGPVPWMVRVVGGVIFGAGLIRLGLALRTAQSPIRERSSASIDARTHGAHL
jgi:hypothetical protein